MKFLIFLLLLINSRLIFADTYPVVSVSNCPIASASSYLADETGFSSDYLWSDANACLSKLNAQKAPPWYFGITSTVSTGSGISVYKEGVSGIWGGATFSQKQDSCPSGGTISGTNCVDAPACISPATRRLTTPYECFTPLECAYPETDSGDGVCKNNTCPEGQTRNPATKQCQVAPSCGSTETYDIYSNTCKLYPLNCPGYTHANTANDVCLPDAPLVCPVGQHDDGTYTCVADDAKGCKSNQQYGTINGVSQCISKANAEQLAKTAHDAEINLAATRAAEAIAKTNNDSAAAALAADPTNATLQAAASSANSAYTSSQSATQAANSSYQEQQKNQDSETLKSIDQTLKGSGISTSIVDSAPMALQSIQDGIGTAMGTDSAPTSFVEVAFFSVDFVTCQVIPMQYKALNYTLNPCEKLAVFRSLMGWFCYIWTAFSIVQIAREQ